MKASILQSAFRVLWVSLFLTACGTAKPKPQTSPRTNQPNSSRPQKPDAAASSVVEKTKWVTANRRGTWSLSSDKVSAVADLVSQNAKKHNIPEDLLFGIIWVESRFDPRAVSPVGARGLMQLMPQTAKYLAECIQWDGRKNSFDPEFNISAGSYYIARLIREFKGDENLALAAYNAGPTKVRRWLAADGLPRVSLEYSSMVQTARSFFSPSFPSTPSAIVDTGSMPASQSKPVVITDEALDRLGLAILIAGFHKDEVSAERQDEENPFD